MKVNWGKVLGAVKAGVAFAGQFDPRIKIVDTAIETIQDSIPEHPGADKKATVEAISDAAISTELAGLTPEQQAQFRALRSTYIDLAVRAKQATADALESRKALAAFLETFKKAA